MLDVYRRRRLSSGELIKSPQDVVGKFEERRLKFCRNQFQAKVDKLKLK